LHFGRQFQFHCHDASAPLLSQLFPTIGLPLVTDISHLRPLESERWCRDRSYRRWILRGTPDEFKGSILYLFHVFRRHRTDKLLKVRPVPPVLRVLRPTYAYKKIGASITYTRVRAKKTWNTRNILSFNQLTRNKLGTRRRTRITVSTVNPPPAPFEALSFTLTMSLPAQRTQTATHAVLVALCPLPLRLVNAPIQHFRDRRAETSLQPGAMTSSQGSP
jgi:hypothetical protein